MPIIDRFKEFRAPIQSVGRIVSVRQGQIEIKGICPNIGDHCTVYPSIGHSETADAEVIAINGKTTTASITSVSRNIRRNDKVVCGLRKDEQFLNIDHSLAIDAMGKNIAARSVALGLGKFPLNPKILDVAERETVVRKINTGDNAIDDCLPLGFGQRIGVFSEAGTGKSMLLRKLISTVECDHVVFAMIGERSREALETIRHVSEAGLDKRVTLVVGLAGDPAPMRARTMATSLSIAQHLANDGNDVLHLVDSLTRFAYAVREVGMASGEPMAQSGMTPSVYRRLPECLEMAGNWKGRGSVTTVAAVLMESQFDDPMSSYVRSLLDGHIYLDKALADRGIFPAIDVLRSRSRLDNTLLSDTEQATAKTIRTDLVNYQKIDEYLHFSGYEAGASASMDRKVSRYESIMSWLQGELATEALHG